MEKGLRMDESSGNLFGVRYGYHVCIVTAEAANNRFTICYSASRAGTMPDQNELKRACKEVPSLVDCAAARYQIVFTAKPNGFSRKKSLENLAEALDESNRILRERSYQDCCQGCGQVTATATCMVGSTPAHICQECYTAQLASAGQRKEAEAEKLENVPAGIVGALAGSLVGVLAIVLLSQIGFVAAISGLIMAVCTIKGYEKLGGKLSKKSVVICVIVMALMVYVGDRINWALIVVRDLQASFIDGFRAVPGLLSMGMIEPGVYYGSLAMVYLFTVVGAFPTIKNALAIRAAKNSVYLMQ